MAKQARLGLYLKDETLKRRIKMAAAKRGMSTTAYCAQAIRERLVREGEITGETEKTKKALIARMDELSRRIGPLGVRASELVRESRRRQECPPHHNHP